MSSVNSAAKLAPKDGGFILVMAIPAFFILSLFLIQLAALASRAERKVALSFRAQVCALERATKRQNFYGELRRLNQRMDPLQKIVYAARAARALPGVNISAGLAETVALTTLRALARYRQGRILMLRISESKNRICPADAFTRAPLSCSSPFLLPTDLRERRALFPDVPPLLEISGRAARAQFRCGQSSGLAVVSLNIPERLDGSWSRPEFGVPHASL